MATEIIEARKTKFRGFHETTYGNDRIVVNGKEKLGRWVFGDHFKTPLTDEATGSKPEDGWYFLAGRPRHCIASDTGCVYEVIPATVCEFTGRCDRNGKEIFEWDRIRYPQRWCCDCTVIWKDGGFTLREDDTAYTIGYILDSIQWRSGGEVEVVGTCFDTEVPT